ncbi:NAD(P)-dependent oxidoreductase [Granulicella sibirica]|uniref:D-3-phosphoglycerate dehydrogenase n=1 Tax=Granulicella sibirica TaxID=2479048 RepID=A0A4Q0SXK0_9BACT|nr:NAD(P)-dependent oxidoreductase [Granulicella sibirica]RXH55873.1 D-3-phosphoglycerate dehydrogenase [Granulicella sibirica]
MCSELRDALGSHELVSWEAGSSAPATDIEVLLASGGVSHTELSNQPKMVLIQTTSTGYETIDVDAASEMGIWASYAPSGLTGNATSVAEFVILLLLGTSRDLQETLRSIHEKSATPRVHRSLNEKTVCIVGLGDIGLQAIDRLRPFGVLLLATDEHSENAPQGVVAFQPTQPLSAVADADYVVVCARASKTNENLIDGNIIRGMKPGSILINIARGTLVDEGELLVALRSGRISAIGLDVLREEPLSPTNQLLGVPQALITPHIAALTDLTLTGTVGFVVKVIQDLSVGKLPRSLLNQPAEPRKHFDFVSQTLGVSVSRAR